MTAMAGNVEQSIYSLDAAIKFLNMDSAEALIRAGPRGSVPYVDPKYLARWVVDVLGDEELGLAISEAVETAQNYKEAIEAARPLMQQRVSQCQAVMGSREEQ